MRPPRLLPSKRPVTDLRDDELANLAVGLTTQGNLWSSPIPRAFEIKKAIAAGILRERARQS